jgi:hypothetical protein
LRLNVGLRREHALRAHSVAKSWAWFRLKSADDILAAIERFCVYNTSPT